MKQGIDLVGLGRTHGPPPFVYVHGGSSSLGCEAMSAEKAGKGR
jgi:hypothetical protein